MKCKTYEIIFLNPKSSTISWIRKRIIEEGFEVLQSDETNSTWKYIKGEKTIEISLYNDDVGPYIIMLCEGITNESLRENMSVCPECGEDNLQISILHCWRNSITEKLFQEGKLIYGPGAYDRPGTRPETHRCLECGCKWYNEADMFYWNEIIKQDGILTKKELGIL